MPLIFAQAYICMHVQLVVLYCIYVDVYFLYCWVYVQIIIMPQKLLASTAGC